MDGWRRERKREGSRRKGGKVRRKKNGEGGGSKKLEMERVSLCDVLLIENQTDCLLPTASKNLLQFIH